MNGIVIRNNHNDTIRVTDYDGDGYYYWGITDNMPAHFAYTYYFMPQQKDADDSNVEVGPLIDWGHYEVINPYENPLWNISGHVSVDTMYNDKRIDIQNGGSLTINGLLYNHNLAIIYIENGGRLTIDGGTIQNGIIAPEVGGNIIIKNGGKIIHGRAENMEIPIGTNLQIQNGSIKYRNK